MTRPNLGLPCALALMFMLAGSAMAQPVINPRQIGPQLPPGVQPHVNLQTTCNVDPSITNVYLTRTSATSRSVRVWATIVNVGRDAWRSGANQQNINIVVYNERGGAERVTQLLPGAAAAGASMLTPTTSFIALGPLSTVDVRIVYDPDILLDSNICNDDANNDNNHSRLEVAQVQGFLRSTSLQQAWHH